MENEGRKRVETPKSRQYQIVLKHPAFSAKNIRFAIEYF